ncbi:extracellular solute-binding protein [Paenibacillus thalictri]|nr:extracellular solute-binding protein [Paenibacillus thalictri]
MKLKNRRSSIITAGLALVVITAGCSQGGTNSPAKDSAASTAAATKEKASGAASTKKIAIEYFAGATVPMLPPKEEDQIMKKINETVNVDLKMTIMTSTDAKNKLNVRIAGGDVPDIMNLPYRDYLEFSKRGLLLDLSPYKDQLKDMQQQLGDSWDDAAIGGKLYGIKNTANMGPRYRTYWIRQDWLNKLGLKAPTTLDELLKVAEAFTFKDPDGNGKQDTYGITGNGMAGFGPIFGAFGVPMTITDDLRGEFYVENGKVQNSLYAPGMKEALTYINKLISAGVVEPEMVASKEAQVRSSAYQGKVGIVFLQWPSVVKDEFMKEWKSINPNADWVQVAAIQGPYGRSNNAWDVAASTVTAVSQTLAKNPEKLERTLQLLKYMGSAEGYRLGSFGIEGKHYNLQNNKVVPTELMAKEGDLFFPYQFYGRNDETYLPVKFEKQIKWIDYSFNEPHTKVYTGGVDYPAGFNISDANRYIQEELIKFAYGKTTVGQYDQFISKLEQTFKYKDYMNSAEQYFKEQRLIQ